MKRSSSNNNIIISLLFLSHKATTTTLIQGFLLPHSPTTTTTQLFSINKYQRRPTIQKTNNEWRSTLSPEQYYILREEGTEGPNSSYLNKIESPGSFQCAGCGSPLFTTDTKFDSGTGWPSFSSPIDNNAISLTTDFKMILPRTECSCVTCGGHLGHVFDDGPDPKTGQRFCMNGGAMTFTEEGGDVELTEEVVVRGKEAPYTVGAVQALPGLVLNVAVGGLLVNSFVGRVGAVGGVGSLGLGDLVPLVGVAYFGVLVFKSGRRLLVSSDDDDS